MNSYKLQDITNGQYFSHQLLLDKNFILLDPCLPFTEELRKALAEWNFKEVISEGIPKTTPQSLTSPAAQVTAPAGSLPKTSPSPKPSVSTDFEEVSFDGENFTTEPKKAEATGINAGVKQVLNKISTTPRGNSEKARMETVQAVYNEYLNYTTALFTRYATHKELNLKEISDTIKELCMFIRDNRRYVLRIQPNPDAKQRDFLIGHSMRTTVFAITIGLQMRLPLSNLIELGVTSVLHEIGQIRLPPQLYLTDKKLSAPEKAQLATHPTIGAKIMKECGFPAAIQLGVLQHHERENGQGYPNKLSGPQIHQYAKIISVACSYEAITTPRHFREAKTTFDAMVEMLQNQQKAYNDAVIKALLFSLSLYPIGAYVFLANGRLAQVTDVNPNDPRNPVIQLIGVNDQSGNPKIVQSDNDKFKIARVLDKKEAADILKSLK